MVHTSCIMLHFGGLLVGSLGVICNIYIWNMSRFFSFLSVLMYLYSYLISYAPAPQLIDEENQRFSSTVC